MLLIDAYMNLHYAVSKGWSQDFTLFAIMTLLAKNVLFFRLEVLIAHVFVRLKVLIARWKRIVLIKQFITFCVY